MSYLECRLLPPQITKEEEAGLKATWNITLSKGISDDNVPSDVYMWMISRIYKNGDRKNSIVLLQITLITLRKLQE